MMTVLGNRPVSWKCSDLRAFQRSSTPALLSSISLFIRQDVFFRIPNYPNTPGVFGFCFVTLFFSLDFGFIRSAALEGIRRTR